MMVMKCFRKSYDIGIVLEPSITKFLSAWPSRILSIVSRKTIGPYNPEVNISYDLTLYRKQEESIFEHEKDILQALHMSVADFGSKTVQFLHNKQDCSPAYTEDRDVGEKKYIGLCLGAGPTKIEENVWIRPKAWPITYWIELANTLVRIGYDVFLFGGKEEQILFTNLDCKLTVDCINYVGRQTLEETICMLQQMRVVVGADTGMVHAAAVQGIPTLSLFGATYYKSLKPYGRKAHYIQSRVVCSPCFGTEALLRCKKSRCMYEISPDMVLNKILEMLGHDFDG